MTSPLTIETTLSGEAADALNRIAERERRPQPMVIESALIAYDNIAAILEENTLYRINGDGDIIEVDVHVPYRTET